MADRSPSLSALALLALLAGCSAAPPLGGDWNELDPAAQEARAVEVLEGLFAAGVDGAGARVADRIVNVADGDGITWTPADGEETSELRWSDVESVEGVTNESLPSRPQSLYLYLRPGSPSVESVSDRVASPLASTGLVRSYVLLRDRPGWSRNRMLAALNHLRSAPASSEPPVEERPRKSDSLGDLGDLGGEETSEPTAKDAKDAKDSEGPDLSKSEPEPEPKPEPAPKPRPQSDLDAIEAKLEKLRDWHERGLIEKDEYDARRKALLEQL